ncbi:MAG: FMN-binding protein [Lachnospiraceae bacterium]|nr:FMN-binding protein [Lachnospiraceae bacterium]
MNKKSIIAFILFAVISALFIVYARDLYNRSVDYYNANKRPSNYLYGEATGEKGKIALRIRIDNSASIKEVVVTEHTDSEIAINALQKLIENSLDKQYYSEIDSVSGATDTSDTYKKIIKDILGEPIEYIDDDDKTERISITEPERIASLERAVVNPSGLKSGIGAYVFNHFQDADYNKNGSLATNEYICAVILDEYNGVIDVRFDHIPSNINFDRFGRVPTGGAKAYTFISDVSKSDFNGIISEDNQVNIYDLEKKIIEYKYYQNIMTNLGKIRSYQPYINALENAIENARYIGTSEGDRLGISVNKVLRKRDIKDATVNNDGSVDFTSSYCMITIDKASNITACMFDNVTNRAVITNNGRILGSREKEIYTLNELSNTNKYTRMDSSKYELKLQFNLLADFMRGKTIDIMLTYISAFTDDRGKALPDLGFKDMQDIDFIESINLISKAYSDAIKIYAR